MVLLNLQWNHYDCNQSTRAVFGMKSMYNFGIMDISTKLKLFDSRPIIKPILLYGCEIWGFENTMAIEAVQIRFYKSIGGLWGQISTPTTHNSDSP